ncbi:hypothetical protein CALCODRAFT_486338 [Calocera cornea HHB12733]|uniref:Uncharacterized protein n=1 Tax=Calocera cornea HHB12733 TaxID=1353952 RepID=A0A165DS81_9BASI|nr:hypothetical protein CALCODRAFT_486338 [Calocera cornea HHB12733]
MWDQPVKRFLGSWVRASNRKRATLKEKVVTIVLPNGDWQQNHLFQALFDNVGDAISNEEMIDESLHQAVINWAQVAGKEEIITAVRGWGPYNEDKATKWLKTMKARLGGQKEDKGAPKPNPPPPPQTALSSSTTQPLTAESHTGSTEVPNDPKGDEPSKGKGKGKGKVEKEMEMAVGRRVLELLESQGINVLDRAQLQADWLSDTVMDLRAYVVHAGDWYMFWNGNVVSRYRIQGQGRGQQVIFEDLRRYVGTVRWVNWLGGYVGGRFWNLASRSYSLQEGTQTHGELIFIESGDSTFTLAGTSTTTKSQVIWYGNWVVHRANHGLLLSHAFRGWPGNIHAAVCALESNMSSENEWIKEKPWDG